MCRWTLGTIERRCGVTVFSEPVTRTSFLAPDSGEGNILLFLLSCTNKRTCGDMQDRLASDVCVHECVIRQQLQPAVMTGGVSHDRVRMGHGLALGLRASGSRERDSERESLLGVLNPIFPCHTNGGCRASPSGVQALVKRAPLARQKAHETRMTPDPSICVCLSPSICVSLPSSCLPPQSDQTLQEMRENRRGKKCRVVRHI